MKTPRGIRNNNPGNIRIGRSSWQGKIPVSRNTDGEFEQFEEMAYGVRAMAILLRNYVYKQGKKDLFEIMHKYSPNHENDTEYYLRALERETGINRHDDAKLWFKKGNNLFRLIKAMIYQENGQYIDDSEISKGISMAGVL